VTDSDRSPVIDVVEAERRLQEGGNDGSDGPILLDVREPAEFDMVRAEGARLLPLSTFLARSPVATGRSAAHGHLRAPGAAPVRRPRISSPTAGPTS